ncbi:hypothetical protein RJ639_026557 [Escallonia herrerae]|uniref:Transposase (putative) gypsy type domain-containing protein n=1 Tax=Escallonia herrerae TaxID=1293975 RepID=A0AA88UXS3_9ASTE|nr:hypothetical protein RJ639_026557 [Escallonia herrerae]
MSRQEEEHVSELSRGTASARVEPTFDPLFLEVGVPLIPYQDSQGLPAKEILADRAHSPKPFDAHTLRSRLSSYDLKILRDKCEIPPSVKLRLPGDGEAANMSTLNEIGVYYDTFVNGFRVPIHPFFIRVLNAYGLAPGQISLHAWHFISFFIFQCHRLDLQPRLRVFRWFFTICSITRQVGWYFLTRRSKANANLFPNPPSSNHNWKDRFLFVKLPKSQRAVVNNVWHPECDTRACNTLKEKNLNETDLDHIEKLKAAEPLESKYPLSNDQLRECGIIFSLEEDLNEEEEGENDPETMSSKGTRRSAGGSRVDSPLFNTQGVLGEVIPDELASVHGVDEEVQDLDFNVLTAEPQPKRPMTEEIVLGLASKDKGNEQSKRKRALRASTSSSARFDTPHRPDWNLSIEESVFKSPHTAWEWSSKGIIPMDRVTLSGYDISHTANGMVQLTSQALAQVQIGAEKLIATEKVLDEERKLVHVENNFRREAKKKVKDLTRALQKVKLSEVSLAARIEQLEAEKTNVGLNAIQGFKRSKAYTDQRLHDSKRALVYGYNTCKKDILKDYADMDLSIYEHKYAHEVAADESNRREVAEAQVISQATVNPSPSTSRSLGMSGAASAVVTVPQRMEIDAGLPQDTEKDASPEAAE